MEGKYYSFLIASNDSARMRRARVPFYVVHVLMILSVVGCVTVVAAISSYSRMLWKAASYNSLRREQDRVKQQYIELQAQVKETDQRLNSLQSLAGEVAMAYGITGRLPEMPFGTTDATVDPGNDFQQSFDEFSYLEKNVSTVMTLGNRLRLVPAMQFTRLGVVPSLWPIVGKSQATSASDSIRLAMKEPSTQAWILLRITVTQFAPLLTGSWLRWTAELATAG